VVRQTAYVGYQTARGAQVQPEVEGWRDLKIEHGQRLLLELQLDSENIPAVGEEALHLVNACVVFMTMHFAQHLVVE
jgi:hypothetical protein